MSVAGAAVKTEAKRPMTVQVIKTKAETGLASQFAEMVDKLPGGAAVLRAREDAIACFQAFGLPHRRIEEWKFTDLRALLKDVLPGGVTSSAVALAEAKGRCFGEADTYVFIDGKLASGTPSTGPVTVRSFAKAIEGDAALLYPWWPSTLDPGAGSVIALNTAFVTDGVLISIAAGVKPTRPIHLVFISTGPVAVRNAIKLEAGAEATIVETHVSAAGAPRHENAVALVTLGERAALHHAVVATTFAGSAHLANTVARLAAHTSYKPFHMTIGEGVMRHQLFVTFDGEHGSLDFGSALLARGAGHADTTMVIDHAVRHCISRELFKCVLDGDGRGVFQGKVIVQPDAQKTDGKQMAQALMLSANAEFDSKPELEIYADDVVCGHGTTSAEIDEDLLFYCQSRGIPLAEARAMLIESFIGEAIDKIDHNGLREALMAEARTWLLTAGT